jgi:hypothetical protein
MLIHIGENYTKLSNSVSKNILGMGATFDPDKEDNKNYRCPMCNTFFISNNPECPTCGTIATPQKRHPIEKQEKRKEPASSKRKRGIILSIFIFITLLAATSIILYDQGLFPEELVPENIEIENIINNPKRDASKIHEDLRIGNSMSSYYEKLRSTYVLRELSEKERCQFAAQLALHDLHKLSFTQIEEKFGEDVGYESYEKASEVLGKAYGYCGVTEDDTDAERIKKILEFVIWYVEYEPEIDDSMRAPVETLHLRSGDCDDFCILTSALFVKSGIDSAIGFFSNQEGAGHAMVLVHLDDLGGYGCAYREDLSGFGLQEGIWIIIEPQSLIEYQDDREWINQWKLRMAIELDFEKATT